MGRKAKYTKEQKVQACEDYLSGRKSAEQIKIELNMGKCGARLVLEWVKSYRVNSHSILIIRVQTINIRKSLRKWLFKNIFKVMDPPWIWQLSMECLNVILF